MGDDFDIRKYEKAYRKDYQMGHRDAARIAEARYRENNRELLYQKQMLWNKKNPDKRSEYAKNNSEKVKAEGREPDRTAYQANYYKKKNN